MTFLVERKSPRHEATNGRGPILGGEVRTEFSRFVVFWSGACLCLTYLAATLVNSGVICWGEEGATNLAHLCIILIFLDLLFLLEYMSVLYEMDDDERGNEE
jgi:hypothetical protein